MSPQEAKNWNEKYSAFYLTRYSPKTGNIVQVGKPRRTIEDALAAAARIDNRNRHKRSHLTFVDVVPPRHANRRMRECQRNANSTNSCPSSRSGPSSIGATMD